MKKLPNDSHAIFRGIDDRELSAGVSVRSIAFRSLDEFIGFVKSNRERSTILHRNGTLYTRRGECHLDGGHRHQTCRFEAVRPLTEVSPGAWSC